MEPSAQVDQFVIVRQLGGGRLSEVYKVVDSTVGAMRILKRIKEGGIGRPNVEALFEREATILAHLRHQNLVNLVIYKAESHYFVLEYVEGRELADLMHKEPHLSPAVTAYLGSVTCGALSAVHSAGITHLDVKPANILLGYDGTIKLTDVGVAKGRSLDQDRILGGTYAYMSPEQLQAMAVKSKSELVGPPSDVFSVGVVMYEALSGLKPYEQKDRSTPATPLWELEPAVPRELTAIVERAIALDPVERYPSAVELQDALNAHLKKPAAGAPDLEGPRKALGSLMGSAFREEMLSEWCENAEALQRLGLPNPANRLLRRVLSIEPGHQQASAMLQRSRPAPRRQRQPTPPAAPAPTVRPAPQPAARARPRRRRKFLIVPALVALAAIIGVVLFLTHRPGQIALRVVDEDGLPVSGLTVKVDSAEAYAGTGGPIRLPGIAPGRHALLVQADGYRDAGPLSLEVLPGKAWEGSVTMHRVGPQGTLVVRVEPPLGGVTVSLHGERLAGERTLGTTSADGTLTRAVAVGTYSVGCRKPLWTAASQDVVVGESARVPVTLRLDPVTAQLSVASSPAGAAFHLERLNGELPEPYATEIRQERTTPFVYSALPVGSYRVVIRLPRGEPVAEEVVVRDGLENHYTKLLTGQLVVASEPSGEQVYLNGTSFGLTPVSKPLAPGVYAVKVRQQEQEARVEPGQVVSRHFVFAAPVPPPSLVVRSAPSQAQVLIDGKPAGSTPLQTEVAAGVHDVAITMPGYAPHEEQVSATAGKEATVECQLEPLQARIAIHADPPAVALVDGRPVGTATPEGIVTDPVAVGSRHVTLRHPVYGEWSTEVDVTQEHGGQLTHRFLPDWVQPSPEQTAAAEAMGVPVFRELDLGATTMRFLLVPPESGSPDAGATYVGVTEVTRAQWQAVMQKDLSRKDAAATADPGRLPAGNVSWRDAALFCLDLTRSTGAPARLPLEAEWERACRAGSSSTFCFGPDEGALSQYAWFGLAGADAHPRPVATKKPNRWGLYDMHGNVWEWTLSASAPATGALRRVIRGGGVEQGAVGCRSAVRSSLPPEVSSSYGAELGFRVVLVPRGLLMEDQWVAAAKGPAEAVSAGGGAPAGTAVGDGEADLSGFTFLPLPATPSAGTTILSPADANGWYRPPEQQEFEAPDLPAEPQGKPASATFAAVPQDVPELVLCQGGAFPMGLDQKTLQAPQLARFFPYTAASYSSEMPSHVVSLRPFLIGKYEVTNAQFCEFLNSGQAAAEVKAGPPPEIRQAGGQYVASPGRGAFPVSRISWKAAKDFCDWYGRRMGVRCHLPTEAQWELAASWDAADGTKRLFPWGNQMDRRLYGSLTELHEVGGLAQDAAPCGAMDMGGNVAEWCADWYSDSYYTSSPAQDPEGPASGMTGVVRGGSFARRDAGAFRTTARVPQIPTDARQDVGFRIVVEPGTQQDGNETDSGGPLEVDHGRTD